MSDVCGRVCPDNRMVSCVHTPGHDDGWCAGLNVASGVTHQWPTPTDDGLAEWDRWFDDLEPLPERVNPVVVVVLVGALIVTVLLLAAAFVALGGVL